MFDFVITYRGKDYGIIIKNIDDYIKFFKKTIYDDSGCIICLENEYDNDLNIIYCEKCTTKVCEKCLKKYNICPICKNPFLIDHNSIISKIFL
jgi:hypothetical protein